MKSKLSWITFVPLLLAACFFKLAQELLPEGTVFGLSSLVMEYLYLASVVLIFLFTVLFCLIDKKIAAYYLPHRNFPAGVFGLILAVILAADGANSIIRMFNSGKAEVLQVIEAVLLMLSAIVFIILGLNHFFSGRDSKRFSLLHIFPALLCAVRMIICFVSFTTISVRFADVSSLICYSFCAMFFYYYAVVLSATKTKSAVKYCFIFGLPASAALIPYGVFHLVFRFRVNSIMDNAQPLEMLLLGIYILCFVIELTAFVRDRDSLAVVEEEQKPDPAEEKVDGMFTNSVSEDAKDRESDLAYLTDEDAEGYIYQEVRPQTGEPEVYHDTEDYLTEMQDDDPDVENQRPKNYEDRLDDIDKLILDISKKKD